MNLRPVSAISLRTDCHWDGTSFNNCPCSHVWDGVANFNMATARANGNNLRIDFDNGYIADPFCRVVRATLSQIDCA